MHSFLQDLRFGARMLRKNPGFAVTAILICLLIYRGTLEAHEDDQVFLDAAGDSMAAEQRMIVAKIDKLSQPIKMLMIASGALLLIAGAIWGWDAYQRF